ncbi:type II toxin-antitoxin system RelE/ParE family toxin [Rhodopseudomonas palustris]|uniref:type II toxin-antitoxin system RelE/ParE family toxin n=1 Tax=Rhodopseudomonas palustris TaxID=1076 RepID=UPI0022EFD893|nr:type II toxin-antitoxin system RelE/ParE family toxin [Rhodopseudomonas palustris]WBU29236.1 type II toxin-antitoxin system RelE/ParE family toxin [Rhodopseudomonas palustris]
MKLRYTIRAAAELDKILNFIDQRSPRGASHVKARVRAVIELLLEYPEAGRETTRGLRRVVAYPYPYVIFYQATPSEIIIHGVRHSARKPTTQS